MKVVIESGLLYTITFIDVFFTHVMGNSVFITTAAVRRFLLAFNRHSSVQDIQVNVILIRAARHGEDAIMMLFGNAISTSLKFTSPSTANGHRLTDSFEGAGVPEGAPDNWLPFYCSEV